MDLSETILKKKGLSFMAHVYAGDPSISFSKQLIETLISSGVDIIELGIPFSDPLADGPVFQAACQRALEGGTRPENVLELARKIEGRPIVLTTYYNIIYHYGLPAFVKRLASIGVQGLIVPDLSYEESDELRASCRKNNVHLINLIAPTTPDDRIAKIAKVASGFIYLVAFSGVTGEKKHGEQLQETVTQIREDTDLPILLGFGISNADDVRYARSLGVDGIIVGSQICRIYSSGNNLAEVSKFVQTIQSVLSASPETISPTAPKA